MTAAVTSPVAFINMPYAPRYERVYLFGELSYVAVETASRLLA